MFKGFLLLPLINFIFITFSFELSCMCLDHSPLHTCNYITVQVNIISEICIDVIAVLLTVQCL